jgi:hypothetical protein
LYQRTKKKRRTSDLIVEGWSRFAEGSNGSIEDLINSGISKIESVLEDAIESNPKEVRKMFHNFISILGEHSNVKISEGFNLFRKKSPKLVLIQKEFKGMIKILDRAEDSLELKRVLRNLSDWSFAIFDIIPPA